MPSGAFCVGWRLTPTPGRTEQGQWQENTRSGKHGRQAFEDGWGWESWLRVCLQKRPLHRGWTWAGWKAQQWGFSRRLGSTAKPAQHMCSLLPWRAYSQQGLSLLHPQPGSDFPACVPSPDKSSHLEGWGRLHRGAVAESCGRRAEEEGCPARHRPLESPGAPMGGVHVCILCCESSRRRRVPGAGLGGKFNSGPGWLRKAMWWVGPSQTCFQLDQ